MSKHGGFLTPKAIANRIKAKGLQKLRWFCQMCQKQCRDENGFKCHCMSEAHLRQMEVFRQNPGKFMDTYSRDFEKEFMSYLKRKGSLRVKANSVYQEMVADRLHCHMNSTKWHTLTSFVLYLGKTGKAVVDNTPKGWYITYINRDPEVIARQEAIAKRDAAALDDEEREAKMLEKQIELAKTAEEDSEFVEEEEEKPQLQEFKKTSEDEKITLQLNAPKKPENDGFAKPKPKLAAFAMNTSKANSNGDTDSNEKDKKRKANALEELMQENEEWKKFSAKKQQKLDGTHDVKSHNNHEHNNNSKNEGNTHESSSVKMELESGKVDGWISAGIVVKIMNKKLEEGKYYKKKGEIIKVHDKYTAEIKLLESNTVLRIDESELETVIPNIDKPIRVVAGKYRGEDAILVKLNESSFSVDIKIDGGLLDGRIVPNVPFEHICKVV